MKCHITLLEGLISIAARELGILLTRGFPSKPLVNDLGVYPLDLVGLGSLTSEAVIVEAKKLAMLMQSSGRNLTRQVGCQLDNL